MRIIAGNLKGHQFYEPHSKTTHPMSDKVRGALFNALGDIDGLTFLDAFAGSGALAFEAASRGAKSVIAIEKDRSSHSVIDRNIKELKLGSIVHAIRANAAGWSIHNMEKTFDVVILAPPYDNLQENLLQTLARRHIKQDGLMVLDWPGKAEKPEFEGLQRVADKNYGDAQLVFYRKTL